MIESCTPPVRRHKILYDDVEVNLEQMTDIDTAIDYAVNSMDEVRMQRMSQIADDEDGEDEEADADEMDVKKVRMRSAPHGPPALLNTYHAITYLCWHRGASSRLRTHFGFAPVKAIAAKPKSLMC